MGEMKIPLGLFAIYEYHKQENKNRSRQKRKQHIAACASKYLMHHNRWDNTEFTENKLFEEHVAYWAIKDYYRKEKSIWRLDSLLPHCQYLSDTTLNYKYVYVCKDGKLELVEKRKTWNTTDDALQELWGKSEK